MRRPPYYDDTAGRIMLAPWTGEAIMLQETDRAIDVLIIAAKNVESHRKTLHNATMAHADTNNDPIGTRRRRLAGQVDRAIAHLIIVAEELTEVCRADRAAQENAARERIRQRTAGQLPDPAHNQPAGMLRTQNTPEAAEAWKAIDATPIGQAYRAAMKEHDQTPNRQTRRAWRDAALRMETAVEAYMVQHADAGRVYRACCAAYDAAPTQANHGALLSAALAMPEAIDPTPIARATAAHVAHMENPTLETMQRLQDANAILDAIMNRNMTEPDEDAAAAELAIATDMVRAAHDALETARTRHHAAESAYATAHKARINRSHAAAAELAIDRTPIGEAYCAAPAEITPTTIARSRLRAKGIEITPDSVDAEIASMAGQDAPLADRSAD